MTDLRLLVIEPNGTVQALAAPDAELEMLRALQGAVGGFVEQLHLQGSLAVQSLVALANEDGITLDLPPNPLATRVLRSMGWAQQTAGPYLNGPVVFCAADDADLFGLNTGEYVWLAELIESQR